MVLFFFSPLKNFCTLFDIPIKLLYDESIKMPNYNRRYGRIYFRFILRMETKGKCSKCGKTFPTEELHLLPESDAYERAYFKSLTGGPAPEPLDEDELRKKYGFTSTDLLCEDCLAELTRQGRE